jgi:hypothetical protein
LVIVWHFLIARWRAAPSGAPLDPIIIADTVAILCLNSQLPTCVAAQSAPLQHEGI